MITSRERSRAPSTTQCLRLINREISREVNEFLDFKSHTAFRTVTKATQKNISSTVVQLYQAMEIINKSTHNMLAHHKKELDIKNNKRDSSVRGGSLLRPFISDFSDDEVSFYFDLQDSLAQQDQKRLDELKHRLPSAPRVVLNTAGTAWFVGYNCHALVTMFFTFIDMCNDPNSIMSAREAFVNVRSAFSTNYLDHLTNILIGLMVMLFIFRLSITGIFQDKKRCEKAQDLLAKINVLENATPQRMANELKHSAKIAEKNSLFPPTMLQLYQKKLEQTLESQIDALKTKEGCPLSIVSLQKKIKEEGVTSANAVDISRELKDAARIVKDRAIRFRPMYFVFSKQLIDLQVLLDRLIPAAPSAAVLSHNPSL